MTLQGKDERGAAAVEFALVVPLLITLLFGIVEFGWIFNQQVSLSNAAREAARHYAVHEEDGGTVGQAEAWGEGAAPTVDWSVAGASIAITQGCDPAKSAFDGAIGEAVTATATIPMPGMTGFFGAILPATLTGKGKTTCGG